MVSFLFETESMEENSCLVNNSFHFSAWEDMKLRLLSAQSIGKISA